MEAKDLGRYRADVCAWAEEVVHVRSPATGRVGPLHLAAHQRDFLREATQRDADGRFVYRTCVVSYPRREGKTMLVSLLLGHRLALFMDQRLLILANSLTQASSNILAVLTDLFHESPALAGLVPDDCFLSSKLMVPALNNVAECVTCAWASIQGRPRVDALAVDELHASPNPKVFDFASQLEGADAQVLIASQAGAPMTANPMWRLHQAREESWVLFDYRQEHVLPWAVALGEREKKTLLPGEWSYQHENAWGATGLKLFATADVEAAAMDYAEPQTTDEWRQLRWGWSLDAVPFVIGVGLDRAGVSRHGDRTVWAVVARFDLPEGEPIYRVLRCAVLPTGSEREVLAEDRHTREVFGGGRVLCESYQCADLVGKLPGATLEAPTAQRQQALFGRLHRLFAEGKIGFPADAGRDPRTGAPGLLKAELVGFEYDAERAGLTKFGTQGGHDDSCYALAWALEGLQGRRAFALSDILGPPSNQAYRESPPTELAGVGDGLGALDWFAR